MSPVNITLIAAHRGEYISDDKDENVQEILGMISQIKVYSFSI